MDIRKVTHKEEVEMPWVYDSILCDSFVGEMGVFVYKRSNGDVRLDLECVTTKSTLITMLITSSQYDRLFDLRQDTDSKLEFLEDVMSWMMAKNIRNEKGLPTTLWKADKDVDILH